MTFIRAHEAVHAILKPTTGGFLVFTRVRKRAIRVISLWALLRLNLTLYCYVKNGGGLYAPVAKLRQFVDFKWFFCKLVDPNTVANRVIRVTGFLQAITHLFVGSRNGM